MRRHLALVALLALFSAAFAADDVSTDQVPTASQASEQEALPERISVDFSNEEIRIILRNVADMYELNLVVPDTLRGRCGSFKYRNVTWQQIFREALTPVGYTFIEDGNIIRVVSQEQFAESQSSQDATTADTADEPPPEEIPAWLCWIAAPFALTHVILAIGVLRDGLRGSARFAPKFIWALMVLLGGLVPLAIYWLIHHSTLARPANSDQPPVLS